MRYCGNERETTDIEARDMARATLPCAGTGEDGVCGPAERHWPCQRDALQRSMLCNIIDRRERPYRWRRVNAVIEATAHENGVKDGDAMPESSDDVVYEQRESISLEVAVAWANEQAASVTLFLYDEGDGIMPE
jgi:hypothetical protein